MSAVDLGWDGDVDIALLAYEQRSLQIFENDAKE